MMRSRRWDSRRLVALLGVALVASGHAAIGCDGESGPPQDSPRDLFGEGGTPDSANLCTNLECQILECLDNPDGTTLRGTVYDPTGRLPIYNAVVYVPNAPLAPIAESTCDRCDAPHSGAPIRLTTTDAAGRFALHNVPAGEYIPLVVQLGKWRREVRVREVKPCGSTTADVRLPKTRDEGAIPRMAITTGAADPLQCLFRKIGIPETEVGAAGSEARIHLYRGGGYEIDGGAPRSASGGFVNGPAFPDAESLWNDLAALKKYDAVLLACEGAENDQAPHKSQAAKQALYDYAKAGGRVLVTHHHHSFLSGSPDPAPRDVVKWSDRAAPTTVEADPSGTFPKAAAFKAWLGATGALTPSGKLALADADHLVDGVNPGALAWLEVANPSFPSAPAIQHVTFDTPINAPEDQLCGRVAFTNVHHGSLLDGASSDDPAKPFPESCQATGLTSQQKALAFLLFDLLSCAQNDAAGVVAPK